MEYGRMLKHHSPIIPTKTSINLKGIKGNQRNSNYECILSSFYNNQIRKKKLIILTLIISVTGLLFSSTSFRLNFVSISLRNCGFKIYPELPLSKNFPF